MKQTQLLPLIAQQVLLFAVEENPEFVSGCQIAWCLVLWAVCGLYVLGGVWRSLNLRCSYPCFNAMKGAKCELCGSGYS